MKKNLRWKLVVILGVIGLSVWGFYPLDEKVNLGLDLADMNVLILGAGGATRGIVGPLLEMRPRSLRIANRTLGKAQALADHFGQFGPVSACRLSMVPVSEPYDLIINATSAGARGKRRRIRKRLWTRTRFATTCPTASVRHPSASGRATMAPRNR